MPWLRLPSHCCKFAPCVPNRADPLQAGLATSEAFAPNSIAPADLPAMCKTADAAESLTMRTSPPLHPIFFAFFVGFLVRFGVAAARFRWGGRDGMRRPTMRSPDLMPTIGGSR
jgi:hypothetical protein